MRFWFNLLSFFTHLFIVTMACKILIQSAVFFHVFFLSQPCLGKCWYFFALQNKNHWSSYLLPATMYILKVNSRKTRKSSKKCSKLIRNTPEKVLSTFSYVCCFLWIGYSTLFVEHCRPKIKPFNHFVFSFFALLHHGEIWH